MVNKQFNLAVKNVLILAQNNNQLWGLSQKFKISFLKQNKNKITLLDTSFLEGFPSNEIVSFVEYFPNLRTLHLNSKGLSGESFNLIFNKLDSLSLPITVISYEELRDFSKKFPNIRKIILGTTYARGCVFFDSIAKFFPKISSISVNPFPPEYKNDDSDYEADRWGKYCHAWISENENVFKNIFKFDVTDSDFQDPSIPYIFKSFPNLNSLDLSNNCDITFENIQESLPIISMKSLCLFGCAVNERGLKTIVNLFPNLEKLDLTCNDLLLSKETISLLKELTNLKSLTIDYQEDFQEAELESHLPNVRIFYFYDE